jgi:GNAT superfamily N-acetyltransferase
MPQRTFTVAQRPELADRLGEVGDPWPEFLRHDEVVNSGWDEMYSRWPELQVVPLDEETDEILGKGNAKPVEWDGRVDMSSGGVVEVFEPEFQEPNALGAIVAVIEPVHQGRGLSGLVIRAMAEAAAAAGLECLIAPVRADLARALPLTPIERYLHWRRDDGLPFDPWIRLHHRLGAEILSVAPRSLDIRGTVSDWEEWTGMSFPESGAYVVEGRSRAGDYRP